MYSKEEIKEAKKRVKKRKEFYHHLVSYVSVNVFLLILNLLTSPSALWFSFPMLGWGIGLLFHYVDVFGIPGFGMLDKDWEAREMDTELRKIRRNSPARMLEDTDRRQEELELKEILKNYDDADFV